MKKVMIILAVCFGLSSAMAQKVGAEKVPQQVKDAFKKAYPTIKDCKYEVEGKNYEVEFNLNKVETSVIFTPIGQLMETETEIAVSALPKGASDYCAKNQAGKKIKEASKIVDAKGVVTYEAELDDKDIVFTDKGIFIKENMKSKDKD